ncbi:hypothetical protein KUV65_11410 [Maritalea mobilis]|uniref:HPr kinase/phosphorylase n=1 Tax=Maritalea mobilis TaxID=483324 RepID=UPI001C972C44|nr:hypothetical protein [Maritalea mobilis]MBY6201974.1 hypothetical protein [Maritalea mobilis]
MTHVPSLTDRAASCDGDRWFFRASAVALGQNAVLILGQPGAGKSTLALSLMAFGATYVADDGVWLEPRLDGPVLSRPAAAPPMIEARGVGILNAGDVVDRARLALVVDLDAAESDRLPVRHAVAVGPTESPLLQGKDNPHLAPAILQLLRSGRAEP